MTTHTNLSRGPGVLFRTIIIHTDILVIYTSIWKI